jgi:hypothetical protein
VVEFGEWLCAEVLKYVPHRQWVFSIPKRLRIYFMFDRKLLTKLKKILKHLDLWEVGRKPPPRANGPPAESFIIYDESSSPCADDYIIDANYPIETYL